MGLRERIGPYAVIERLGSGAMGEVIRATDPKMFGRSVAIHDGRASLYHGQADGTYPFAEGGRVQPDRWYHLAAVARRN